MSGRLTKQEILETIRDKSRYWFVQKKFRDAHLEFPVSTIQFVAYDDDEQDQSANPSNHWRIVLLIPQDQVKTQIHSVALDTVVSKVGDDTADPLQARIYSASRNVTISTIAENIIAIGRDHYRYHPEHEGCSCWALVVARDLAKAHIITDADADRAEEVMGRCWPNDVEREIKPGTFDNEALEN